MSRSGGISQLLKGVAIGVVLIMAIIGTMSLLEKDKPEVPTITGAPSTSNPSSSSTTPEITLNPQNNTQTTSNDASSTPPIGDLTDSTTTQSQTPTSTAQADKPTLVEENTTPAVNYGMMLLSAVNANNQQSLKANFVVYDKDNNKVAQSLAASNPSYRLPAGQYKVESTLTRIDEATQKVVPVATKSRYIIVRANSTSSKAFEFEPPANIGVLQVTAKQNGQTVRANFIVQKADGELVASRSNVTNSLFKLPTGTYKVSVTQGDSRDFKSVEVKSGESTQTVFNLKGETIQQGRLIVRILDTRSDNAVRADINIVDNTGKTIQDLKAATQTELLLATGEYQIRISGANGTATKRLSIRPNQTLNEIFRVDTTALSDTQTPATTDQTATTSPNNNTTNQATNNTNNTVQINDNVTIKPVTPTDAPVEQTSSTSLRITALDEATKRPIKSNIYIQTLTGKHLDKRTYVEGAQFQLAPGVYRVTVRAKNRNNTVKTIRINANQTIDETFLMVNPDTPSAPTLAQNNNANSNNATNPTSTGNITPAPFTLNKQSPSVAPQAIETGLLSVLMRAPQNQRNTNLNTNFIINTAAGKKIVELTSVPSGNFKLDVGNYDVTAIYNNKRRTQRVQVRPNQRAQLVFNTTDFLAAKGTLRSRIVDETGRPIKGNLIVSNRAGQIVARANNVSSAVFKLPPVPHTISVNIQGLSGSEAVNIVSDETTVQTFTVAPQR